ncbi:MAG TPA: Gfo/Idh/MocA family oxidoreductase, partial [Fimbriimonadaceae bacterium]|nr:Gfo/Idh/MocA family oxidoreductase [Fimbriimonadaceae bacterium]
MSERVGIGVVGAGSIGVRGALMHLCLDDVQDRISLAAVCDPAPGRAHAAAEKFGVAKAYERYEDLLADPNVHAITLGTPIGMHFDQGMAAIKAGKHIHFNKTMTTTAEEAKTLIAEAKANRIKLVASPGQMTRPDNREIRRIVRSGELGKVAWASVGAAFGAYHEEEGMRTGNDPLSNVNPAWYWRKPGGGPLYDMTVYGLHTLTGILGPAKRVTGMSGVLIPEREFKGEKYPVDADDNSFGLLDFGGSTCAFIYGAAIGCNDAGFGRPSFFGTKGSILAGDLNGQPIRFPGDDDGLNHYVRGRHIKGEHQKMGEAHVF